MRAFLTLSCVSLFSDSSHHDVCVCTCAYSAYVCVLGRVYAAYSLHRGAGGGYAGATEPQRQLTAPHPPPPHHPSGPLLLAWLAALEQGDTPQALPFTLLTQHTHTHTQTNSNSEDSLHPPPPCSGPIDTALRLSSDQSFGGAVLPEENPIQRSLSEQLILSVCQCVCARMCARPCTYVRSDVRPYVLVFVNDSASVRETEGTEEAKEKCVFRMIGRMFGRMRDV